MYTQLALPNQSIVGRIGYCLEMAENVYHTPHLYANATEAYRATQFKHTEALPDASVPVWFSYIQGGVDLGHVVAYVPGRGFLSSPFKQDGTQVWFASIADVEKTLNCHCLGWSEDLATIRIVKEEDMKPVSQQIPDALTVQLAYNIGLNRQPNDKELQSWNDKTVEQLMRTIAESEEHKNVINPLPPEAIKLKPGFYQFEG